MDDNSNYLKISDKSLNSTPSSVVIPSSQDPTSAPSNYNDIKENDNQVEESVKNSYASLNYDRYIVQGSDYRYIEESDLYGLSASECRIARNEIYARHGLSFMSQDLKDFFESKNWYKPYTSSINDIEQELNEFEKANILTIKEYEDKGCPYASFDKPQYLRTVWFNEGYSDESVSCENSVYLEYTGEHEGYATLSFSTWLYECDSGTISSVSNSTKKYYFKEDNNLNGIFYDINNNKPVGITYSINLSDDYSCFYICFIYDGEEHKMYYW